MFVVEVRFCSAQHTTLEVETGIIYDKTSGYWPNWKLNRSWSLVALLWQFSMEVIDVIGTWKASWLSWVSK